MNVNELEKKGEQANSTHQQTDVAELPETEHETITISGKKFNVNKDIAQAISSMTKDNDRRYSEFSQELGELRKFKTEHLSQLQKEVENKETDEFSTLIYEDPNKFIEKFEEKIENKLTQKYEQARNIEREEKLFWDSIWAENKDLSVIKEQASDVIRLIGQKYSSLNLQNTKNVRDAIAAEARDWIKKISGGKATFSSDGFVEGSSSQSTQGSKQNTEKDEARPGRRTFDLLNKIREDKARAMLERR